MPSFDFITNPEFRTALEADFSEMERCQDAAAWKSVQVLAGSIVEALLLDYLTSTDGNSRPKQDPLKFDLAKAVEICCEEGVISERTADLSAVVRSYRNLIHPGRAIRLGEEQPTKESASIASALVAVIIAEVAKRRRAEFGLTAEQIMSKVERDSNSLGILRLLLQDVHDYQKARLLDLIPPRYFEIVDASPLYNDFPNESHWRLQRAYRMVLDTLPEQERARAAERFVQVLREADGDYVSKYRDAFFEIADMRYLDDSMRALVARHIITTSPKVLTPDAAQRRLASLSEFLPPSEVRDWADPFVRTIVSASVDDETRDIVRESFQSSIPPMSLATTDALIVYLQRTSDRFRRRGFEEDAVTIARLATEVEEARLPF